MPSLPPLVAPPARTETAPAVARQVLEVEPSPPVGVGATRVRRALEDAVGPEKAEGLWRWMTLEMPEWGREGWRRTEEMARELIRRENNSAP